MLDIAWRYLLGIFYPQLLALMAVITFSVTSLELWKRYGAYWAALILLSLLEWSVMIAYHGWIIVPYTAGMYLTFRYQGEL